MKRKGFNIFSLIGGIALAATLGVVATPSIGNFYTKEKVKKLVEKELFLKNIYEVLHSSYAGDETKMPSTMAELLTKAKADGLMPDNYTVDTGFGGNIEFSRTGSMIEFKSDIPADKTYAREVYSSILGSNVTNKDGLATYEVGHVYSLGSTVLENQILLSAFEDRYLKLINDINNTTVVSKTTAQTLDMSLADNKGKEWWDYDNSNNTYSVMGWSDEADNWVVKSIENSTGITDDGSYVANSTDDINAANVKSGSKLLVKNSDGDADQYVSIGGEWALMGSGTSSGGSTTNVNYGADNEAEYNRQLAEEKASNPSVLTQAEAEALAEGDRVGIEWWEYDLDLSRYYIWKWDADVSAWYIDIVKEINPYQETSIIAYRQVNKRYLTQKLSSVPATKVGNGVSLDLDDGFGVLSAYLSVNGLWAAVEDDSYIREDSDGAFVINNTPILTTGQATSNTLTDFTGDTMYITASHENGSNYAWKIADRGTDSGWSTGSGATPSEPYADIKYKKKIKLTTYDIYPHKPGTLQAEAPWSWELLGTNDNVTYDLLDSVVSQTSWKANIDNPELENYRRFTIDNPGYYRFYRFKWLRNNSGDKNVRGEGTSGSSSVEEIEFKTSVLEEEIEFNQELDQSTWEKYKTKMVGIGYEMSSEGGVQTVKTGDYVLNEDDGNVYKRLGGVFTANIKSNLSGGGINYSNISSWKKIGKANAKLSVSTGDKVETTVDSLTVEFYNGDTYQTLDLAFKDVNGNIIPIDESDFTVTEVEGTQSIADYHPKYGIVNNDTLYNNLKNMADGGYLYRNYNVMQSGGKKNKFTYNFHQSFSFASIEYFSHSRGNSQLDSLKITDQDGKTLVDRNHLFHETQGYYEVYSGYNFKDLNIVDINNSQAVGPNGCIVAKKIKLYHRDYESSTANKVYPYRFEIYDKNDVDISKEFIETMISDGGEDEMTVVTNSGQSGSYAYVIATLSEPKEICQVTTDTHYSSYTHTLSEHFMRLDIYDENDNLILEGVRPMNNYNSGDGSHLRDIFELEVGNSLINTIYETEIVNTKKIILNPGGYSVPNGNITLTPFVNK